MIKTGWEGTITYVAPRHADFSVKVRWDKSGSIGAVVAGAFDLEPIA